MTEAPPEYDRIQELAEQIYKEATSLSRPDRHTISDAAKLISWICYLADNPGNSEATEAIGVLRRALAKEVGTTVLVGREKPSAGES